MLTLPPRVRVWISLDPVDMRRSFDGLAALVAERMGLDPTSGHLFAFVNRRRSLLKLLFFDRTGYTILFRRLEQGTFQLPEAPPDAVHVEIDSATLGLILEGIDLRHVVRRRRFQLPRVDPGEI